MLVVGILLKVDLGDVIVQEKIVDTLNEVSMNHMCRYLSVHVYVFVLF